jgi:hypothetical protein
VAPALRTSATTKTQPPVVTPKPYVQGSAFYQNDLASGPNGPNTGLFGGHVAPKHEMACVIQHGNNCKGEFHPWLVEPTNGVKEPKVLTESAQSIWGDIQQYFGR